MNVITQYLQRIQEWSFFFDRHAGPRLRRLERRGLLWAMLSLFFFSAGTTIVTREWQREIHTGKDVERYLRTVVRAEHTSRRNETELGKLALLLANANQVGKSELPLAEVPDPWRQVLRTIASKASSPPETSPELEPCGGDARLTAGGWGIPGRNAAHWAAMHRPYRLDRPDLPRPLYALDPVGHVDGFALGPAGCIRGIENQGVSTFIPSPVMAGRWRASSHLFASLHTVRSPTVSAVRAVSPVAATTWTIATSEFLSPQVTWLATATTCDSPALRDAPVCALASAAETLDAKATQWSNNPALAQVYFIASDGSLAVWNRSAFTRGNMWREPLHGFGVGSYVTHFTQRPSFVNRGSALITPAYIDYLGVGMVRTVCTPVHAPGRPRQDPSAPMGQTGFLGVACLDVTVPVQLADDQIRGPATAVPDRVSEPVDLDNPLFQAELFCESNGNVFAYAPGRGTCSVSRERAPISTEEATLIVAAVQGAFDRGGVPDEPANEEPENLGAAAVLLHKVDRSDQRVVALLRPRLIEPDTPVLLLGFVCMALAFLFAVIAAVRGQRERNRLTTLEILRSLPVGVAMMDEKQHIIFGNDRAEELLGAPLPTFWDDDFSGGIDKEIGSQRFDRWVIREGRDSKVQVCAWTREGLLQQPNKGDPHAVMRPDEFYDERAPALRSRGRPYAYLAWVRGSGRKPVKMLIRGTPILRDTSSWWSRILGGPVQRWYALGVFDQHDLERRRE